MIPVPADSTMFYHLVVALYPFILNSLRFSLNDIFELTTWLEVGREPMTLWSPTQHRNH